MIHIVSFSSGLSSALTVERVALKYQSESIRVVFMDTQIEDNDNYRFMEDCARRWKELYGLSIIRLKEGRTPYQVFEDEHIIPNNRVAPCTRRLKIEMFVQWVQSLDPTEEKTIHIGYDYSEIHRCAATTKNYNAMGWNVDYPLLWAPVEERDYSEVAKQDWHIEPPRMYSMGYSHANCGGRCVKQGKNDWIRTLLWFPERYAEVEAWEQKMRENPINAKYTLAKWNRKGVTYNVTLRELREEYVNHPERFKVFDIENEQCVVCGIGNIMEEN